MSIVISGVNNNDKITASDGTIDLLSGVTYGSEITVPSLKLGNNIQLGNAGIVTCNILSTTSVVGIATTGSLTNPCGTLSFGKISGFSRSSSPISIGVTGLNIDAGLSTFPILQRRGIGLRDSGGLSK